MTTPWNRFTLLGAGGRQPGLYVHNGDTSQTHRALSFEDGDSVYSIAVAPQGDLLAAGTSSGSLLLMEDGFTEASAHQGEGKVPIRYPSPVLSLCFMGRSRLAVATAKKTFWLDIAAPYDTHDLETRGDVVCALTAVSETELFGLSPNGQLLGWSIPEGHLVRRQCGPACGQIWGIVRLEYWLAASVLAYGGDTGDLVLYAVQGTACEVRRAHTGGLYAIASHERHLLTAGRDDGLLKLWQADSATPVAEHRCSTNAVSAAFIAADPSKIVLIDARGQADVFTTVADQLQSVASIQGDSYRVVVGPDLSRVREAHLANNAAQMTDIMTKAIPRLFDLGQYGEIEKECEELTRLGYPQIALQLRAEVAKKQGDKLGELRFRHMLHEKYTGTDPWSVETRRQYADLLLDVWCFEDAAAVFIQLASYSNATDCRAKHDQAKQMMKRLMASSAIADPANSLKNLIQAASVVGRSFRGRWVVAQKKARWFEGIILEPMDVLQECQKEESGIPAGVTYAQEEVTLVRSDGIRDVVASVFECPNPETSAHLQFVLLYEAHVGKCTVTPMLALSANGSTTTGESEPHNNGILAVLGDTADDWGCRSWIGETIRVTGGILRAVYTRKMTDMRLKALRQQRT